MQFKRHCLHGREFVSNRVRIGPHQVLTSTCSNSVRQCLPSSMPDYPQGSFAVRTVGQTADLLCNFDRVTRRPVAFQLDIIPLFFGLSEYAFGCSHSPTLDLRQSHGSNWIAATRFQGPTRASTQRGGAPRCPTFSSTARRNMPSLTAQVTGPEGTRATFLPCVA